jgi:Uma2 family endonuclease
MISTRRAMVVREPWANIGPAMAETPMTTPTSPHYTWTYAEYARFPDDGNRYEVIDGEVLVTPAQSPLHQHVLLTLSVALRQYAEAHDLGFVLPDVDLLFVSGQFLRPDLVFVPKAEREGITDRGVEVPPGLIVEILSPTSSAIDRVKKPRRYGDFGVPEYWVADPAEGVVWVWRFAAGARGARGSEPAGEAVIEPERVEGRIEWQPAGAPEPLVLETAALFRPL